MHPLSWHWFLVGCLLVSSGSALAQQDERKAEAERFDDIEFLTIGRWSGKKAPKAGSDRICSFRVEFAPASVDEVADQVFPAIALRGEVLNGERLVLVRYCPPGERDRTYRVFAMTPSAERLVTHLKELPAEKKNDSQRAVQTIRLCLEHLDTEDSVTRVIAYVGFIGWAGADTIQAGPLVSADTLRKLSGDASLGIRGLAKVALLLTSQSPIPSDELARLTLKLRDQAGDSKSTFLHEVSLAYLAALRERGIPILVADEKWGSDRRRFVHWAIESLQEADRPLDRDVVRAFCEESLKIDGIERVDAICNLEEARLWDAVPQLQELYRQASRGRTYIVSFVLAWRDSVDDGSEAFHNAEKMLREFKQIDVESFEFAKEQYDRIKADKSRR